MECNEVQALCGPYLDSELDARTTLEIEQHLKSCPECARRFAREEKLDTQIRAGLNRGQRTPALWDKLERSVVAPAPATWRPSPASPALRPGAWHAALSALSEQLQAGWRRSRWAWSGLAVAWAVIFALNLTARARETTLVAAHGVPSVSEVRLAWKEKQLLMADLAFASEPAPTRKAKTAPPGPRGERFSETFNT